MGGEWPGGTRSLLSVGLLLVASALVPVFLPVELSSLLPSISLSLASSGLGLWCTLSLWLPPKPFSQILKQHSRKLSSIIQLERFICFLLRP